MIYYTQFIFIKEGAQETFHAFEDEVLPLLIDHNGNLVYRIRPKADAFVAASADLPYEIHVVTFPSKDDFERYKNDPRRLESLPLKTNSVERIVLIEGKAF